MFTVLLDSNIIIDAINGRASRFVQLQALVNQDVALACTSINITEIYMGMLPTETSLTGRFIDSLEFYAVTPDAAKLAGELFSIWRKRGHTLALTDLTIAAVCIVNGLQLFTENKKHFPMAELQIYSPTS